MTFDELKLTRQYLNALEDLGFSEPTEIQEQAIPVIKSGKDVIGIAQTGTGKTAAYLLPMLMQMNYAQGLAPRGLVLVPTRELALQVQQQAEQLSKYTNLRPIAVYGGKGIKTQTDWLEPGLDLLIATPGRFMDLYKAGAINTKKMRMLVLDEADRMLDMGFLPQLNTILEVIPVKRQNLLFSATFSPRVEKLTHEFLEWPERVEVTPQATPVETVESIAYEAENFLTKVRLLEHLYRTEPDMDRVIVFCRTKTVATNVSRYIDRKTEGGVKLLHSNKDQNARLNAIAEFKEGHIRTLVATDIAARGTDVDLVSHVVNFEVPLNSDDYVHRIGRTGRAQQTGKAITFINPAERWYLVKIQEHLGETIETLPMPEGVEQAVTTKGELREMAREIDRQKKKDDPTYGGAFHDKKRKTGKGKSYHNKRKKR